MNCICINIRIGFLPRCYPLAILLLSPYYPLTCLYLESSFFVSFLHNDSICICILLQAAFFRTHIVSEPQDKKTPRPSKSSRSPKRYINYQVLQPLCLHHQTERAHRGTTSPPELLPDIRESDYAGCPFLYHAEYELATSQALWHHL